MKKIKNCAIRGYLKLCDLSPNRKPFPILLLCLTVVSVTFLHLLFVVFDSGAQSAFVVSPDNTWKRISIIKGTKNILLCKNSWGFRFGTGRAAFLNAGCRVSNCLITYNETLMPLEKFDAFVIHPPTQRTPWNYENRRPDQVFVMFSTEPPVNMPDMTKFDNYFNWTMTYRQGSNFHLKYGDIIPMETAPSNEDEAKTMRQQMLVNTVNPAEGKTKLAIWMVTNCQAKSNRQEYIKILSKYINVDIYSADGKCGGRDACPRDYNENVCYNDIEKTYKFYLSFENSICEEYVTEKFFEMMARNIVPVVLGGVNYSAIAPSHSYINALDYTPRQLADYLNELDRNDKLYAEYFWWKPHYQVRNLYHFNREAFCNLCEALHTNSVGKMQITGLKKWYIDDSNCVNNLKFVEN